MGFKSYFDGLVRGVINKSVVGHEEHPVDLDESIEDDPDFFVESFKSMREGITKRCGKINKAVPDGTVLAEEDRYLGESGNVIAFDVDKHVIKKSGVF